MNVPELIPPPDGEPQGRPNGIVGALLALADLEQALATIEIAHPAYQPGSRPTLDKVVAQQIEMLQFGLRNLDAVIKGYGPR